MSRYLTFPLLLILLHVSYQYSEAQVFKEPVHQMVTENISILQAEKKNSPDTGFFQKKNISGYDWKFTAEEFTIGSLTGALASLPIAMVGVWIRQPEDVFEAMSAAAYSMYAGYMLGSAYGVYLVNKKHQRPASYLASAGLSVIGGGVGLLILQNYQDSNAAAIAMLLLPPAGAIIGNRFYSSTIVATRQVSFQYSGIMVERKVYPAIRFQYHF